MVRAQISWVFAIVCLQVGSDGQLRMAGSAKKEEVKIFQVLSTVDLACPTPNVDSSIPPPLPMRAVTQ